MDFLDSLKPFESAEFLNSLVFLDKVFYGLVCYGMDWYGSIWFGMIWYGLIWFGMVWFGWFGLVWFGIWFGMGGGMLGNVLECSRMFWETPKSFMVGGGGGGMLQLQSLLRSRLPESDIEIELERTREASRVDLEMVSTRVWQLMQILKRTKINHYNSWNKCTKFVETMPVKILWMKSKYFNVCIFCREIRK